MRACAAALLLASSPALAQDNLPIPVRVLFANPATSSPAIAPGGGRIAMLVSRGDLQIVVVRDLRSGFLEPIGKMDDPRVRFAWLGWAKPDVLWVTNQQKNPYAIGTKARATQLFSISFAKRTIYSLGFTPAVIHWLPGDPENVLIDDWGRVRRMRASDGRTRNAPVQARTRGIGSWHADGAGRIRAGESLSGDELSLWARSDEESEFVRVAGFDVFAEGGPSFAAFHDDPGKLYVTALHEGRMALFALDIATRELGAPVFAHPEVDVAGVLTEPGSERVIGAVYVDDRPRIAFFDERAKRAHEAVSEELAQRYGEPVDHYVTSVDRAGQLAIVEASSDVLPPTYYLHDREHNELTRLFERDAALDYALAHTERVTYQARDGLAIPAYLTRARGAKGALPTIVIPHGGPRARDMIGWNPELQLFASRGYAVFQMNFRGSEGYGRAFEEAGHREWGGKMQDDITDGVRWLVREGIADPDRIGIYGTSYGGYAALMGLIRTPELFRAGAAYAAVTDLPSMLADNRWYGRFAVTAQREAVGGGWGDGDRLRALSPRRRAGEVSVPVLLGHGEQDDRVRVDHSRKLRSALASAGKDIQYLEFEHEIHGFALEANRIRWYEALVAFFEKNLAVQTR